MYNEDRAEIRTVQFLAEQLDSKWYNSILLSRLRSSRQTVSAWCTEKRLQKMSTVVVVSAMRTIPCEADDCRRKTTLQILQPEFENPVDV
jgi:hypothetical protein